MMWLRVERPQHLDPEACTCPRFVPKSVNKLASRSEEGGDNRRDRGNRLGKALAGYGPRGWGQIGPPGGCRLLGPPGPLVRARHRPEGRGCPSRCRGKLGARQQL